MNFEFNSGRNFQFNPFGADGTNPTGNSSPYYTIANQYIPRDWQGLLRWTDYILAQSPLITETLRKYATYPLTEFLFDTENDQTRKIYKDLFTRVRMKAISADAGMSYFSKGNAFISVNYRITRFLECPQCSASQKITAAKFKLKKKQFFSECVSCAYVGQMKRTEYRSKSTSAVNLILWNPAHISVHANAITGISDYYYTIPKRVRDSIMMGDPIYLEDTPWEIIEAALNGRDFKFKRDQIFHLKNLSISQHIEGVGTPPLISLYHLVFYEAMLRKANEAVASEYLMPLRIISPAPQSANSDPIANASMRNFVSNMERMVQRHRRDGNYIGFAPVPISYQAVSGEGRNLLVRPEIEQAQQTILLGMGVSQELLSGTTNWTSSTVGLRMLTNMLSNYVGQLEEFYEWFVDKVSVFLKLRPVKVTLAPFKLTDDSENKAIYASLYQAGKISDTTMMEILGIDFEEEQERIVEDQVARAVLDVNMKADIDLAVFAASKEVHKTMQDNKHYTDSLQEAQGIVAELVNVDSGTKRQAMAQLQATDYAKYLMVSKLLEEEERHQTAALKQQADQQAMAAGGTAGEQAQEEEGAVQPEASPAPPTAAPAQASGEDPRVGQPPVPKPM